MHCCSADFVRAKCPSCSVMRMATWSKSFARRSCASALDDSFALVIGSRALARKCFAPSVLALALSALKSLSQIINHSTDPSLPNNMLRHWS